MVVAGQGAWRWGSLRRGGSHVGFPLRGESHVGFPLSRWQEDRPTVRRDLEMYHTESRRAPQCVQHGYEYFAAGQLLTVGRGT